MKRFSVVFYIGRTTSQVFVHARNHTEAYEQGLLSLRYEDSWIRFAIITPQAEKCNS